MGDGRWQMGDGGQGTRRSELGDPAFALIGYGGTRHGAGNWTVRTAALQSRSGSPQRTGVNDSSPPTHVANEQFPPPKPRSESMRTKVLRELEPRGAAEPAAPDDGRAPAGARLSDSRRAASRTGAIAPTHVDLART